MKSRHGVLFFFFSVFCSSVLHTTTPMEEQKIKEQVEQYISTIQDNANFDNLSDYAQTVDRDQRVRLVFLLQQRLSELIERRDNILRNHYGKLTSFNIAAIVLFFIALPLAIERITPTALLGLTTLYFSLDLCSVIFALKGLSIDHNYQNNQESLQIDRITALLTYIETKTE